MLEELDTLEPDALVIDSLDRFSRSKFEGIQQFMALADKNVKLFELEHSTERPLNLKDDEDRDYVWQRFADAEGEHRRIKKRQRKRYQSQRERGYTTTNRPAFGLKLAGDNPGERYLVPDPETAPIVQEMDRRYIAGWSQRKILDWLKDFPGAWRSKRGLSIALRNEDDRSGFIAAGVRTPEIQAQIRQHTAKRYSGDRVQRKYVHEMAGLFACGECVREGVKPHEALLSGKYIVANEPTPWTLYCQGHRKGKQVHKEAYFAVVKLLPGIFDYLEMLKDRALCEAVLERWKKLPRVDKMHELRTALERQLANLDEDEADIDCRANAAFTLIASGSKGVVAEATAQLERVNAERIEVHAKREAIRQRLTDLPVVDDRDAQANELFELQHHALNWDESVLQLNEDGTFKDGLLRPYLLKWVQAMGHPVVRRRERDKKGWRQANWTKVVWPEFDRLARTQQITW
jgi:DNA invertase Pin-like site-specific DNA recombinase